MEDWLRSVGLGHLHASFAAQGITLDQCGELTDAELRELGLTIGDRRRFRRALHDRAPAPPARPAAPATGTLTERRPLTMMFIDLVGSSDLGERLEPEDMLEVIRGYRELCGAAIRRYGGAVARQIGDGTLAYFSYPVAHENDPERAVRAALEIARDIEHLPSPAPEPLQVRIGIATGRVIISDLLAGGSADLRSVVGSAANLAARLQGVARPGGVVIAAETHARVRALFACEDLGAVEMKGFAEKRQAFRVLHELPASGWRPGAHPQRLTPFCARRAELAALGEHWAAAADGAGRAVLVAGEAGIGKSRLIETFLALHCQEECRVVQLAASPFDVDSALQPFATWLRAEAGLAHAPRGGAAPASELAELAGVDVAEAATLTPAQLRDRTLDAIGERLLALAADSPLCLVLEDLHWLDPSSLDLLERLAPRLAGHPALLLMTARDGVAAPWLAPPLVATLTLARLTAEDVTAMVHTLFHGEALPGGLVGQLVHKSDGVPLYVVELLRGVLADGAEPHLAEDGEARIPASLHESLMARLDRAGLAKEIAQVAAVIGRSVRPGMLAAVAGREAAELEPALAALEASGVLFRDAERPGEAPAYTFNHALLRDAAYDSLLRDHRQHLHGRAADMLVARDPETVARQPELAAHHLAEAGRAEQAAPYFLDAARRSLTRSALLEASRLLRRGLAALDRASGGGGTQAAAAVADWRLKLMALLGPALMALKGPGSPDTRELYAQAYEVCEALPEDAAHFPIYWGWWRMHGDFFDKVRRAEALLQRARPRGDAGMLLQAHHCAWGSLYCVGALAECQQHAETGLRIYASGDFTDHARLYGNHDARVCAHGELAELFWQRGLPAEALAQEQAAVDWSHELRHVGSIVHGMDYQLMHRAMRRDLPEVYALGQELARFTAEHGFADHHAKSLIFRGWALALAENPAEGLAMLEQGVARQRDIGTDEDFPVYLALLAEALLRAGQPERAVAELQAATVEFARTGLTATVPDVLRLLGDATLAADRTAAEAAQAWYGQAAAMAEGQGAWMLHLRAATAAARLHLRNGASARAAGSLADALARVADDPEDRDVRAARALLADAGWRRSA